MTKEDLSKLTLEIDVISGNFENKPFTDNIRLLTEDFDLNSLSSPNHYLQTIDQFTELLRQT